MLSTIAQLVNLLVKSNVLCYNVPLLINKAGRPPFTAVLSNSDSEAAFFELHDRIRALRDDIAATAAAAGRSADEVTIVAVTKGQPVETVSAAISAGLTIVGENYVREAVDKKAATPAGSAEWHLIGHLQTNKASLAIQHFYLIQSVDSQKLASALSKIATQTATRQRVLIQVHLGDESTKSGASPDEALDLVALAASEPGLTVEGLMGIAPQGVDPRPYFRELRRLFDRLPADQRKVLSMGMSADYKTAIEEGSTMVRIGTGLFGQRQ